METFGRNTIGLAGILAMLIILGLVGGIYWNKTRTMTDRINWEERRADSLLSVKLRLEGDNRDLTSQLELAIDENESLGKRINTLHGQLDQRYALESQFRQQTIVRTRIMQALNRNLSALTMTRDSLENQIEALNNKISWLNNSKGPLLNETKDIQ